MERLIQGAALAIVLLAGPSQAMPPVVAAFLSASRESQLTFQCGADRRMWLAISGPHESWGRDPAAEIRIGRRSFRLRAITLHDTLLLSDLPAPAKGVSRSLVSAAKSGRDIDLTGLPAKALPLGLRAFRLAHARAAIENVEKSCGLPPAH